MQGDSVTVAHVKRRAGAQVERAQAVQPCQPHNI